MCVSCGCGNLTESHGDQRNITIDTLKKAAEAQGIGLKDVLKNIIQSIPVIIKNWKTYA